MLYFNKINGSKELQDALNKNKTPIGSPQILPIEMTAQTMLHPATIKLILKSFETYIDNSPALRDMEYKEFHNWLVGAILNYFDLTFTD